MGTNAGPIGYLPEYYNISSVYDPNTLVRLANGTGGKFYEATNLGEVKNAYDSILSESKEAYLYKDLGFGSLIVALTLILLEWGLISTRFKGLPG